MRPTAAALFAMMPLTTVACGPDPAREVVPMASPLASAAPIGTVTEIIPLEDVRRSQAAVSQRVANTEITITYSRPVARGCELFGGIVPHGEVWNPGADQATLSCSPSM